MKAWVNGSFDVVHIGHIKLLEEAAKYGKVRVGLDSDRRIRERKGYGRPYNTLQDRYDHILSLNMVSSIVTFDSDEELENEIKAYSPDYMLVGDDYIRSKIIGAQFSKNIVIFTRIPNKSTSEILGYENSSNR